MTYGIHNCRTIHIFKILTKTKFRIDYTRNVTAALLLCTGYGIPLTNSNLLYEFRNLPIKILACSVKVLKFRKKKKSFNWDYYFFVIDRKLTFSMSIYWNVGCPESVYQTSFVDCHNEVWYATGETKGTAIVSQNTKTDYYKIIYQLEDKHLLLRQLHVVRFLWVFVSQWWMQ